MPCNVLHEFGRVVGALQPARRAASAPAVLEGCNPRLRVEAVRRPGAEVPAAGGRLCAGRAGGPRRARDGSGLGTGGGRRLRRRPARSSKVGRGALGDPHVQRRGRRRKSVSASTRVDRGPFRGEPPRRAEAQGRARPHRDAHPVAGPVGALQQRAAAPPARPPAPARARSSGAPRRAARRSGIASTFTGGSDVALLRAAGCRRWQPRRGARRRTRARPRGGARAPGSRALCGRSADGRDRLHRGERRPPPAPARPRRSGASSCASPPGAACGGSRARRAS